MKELDYEDWQKNPTPRKMWVWNDNEEEKIQKKVLYVFHRKGHEDFIASHTRKGN